MTTNARRMTTASTRSTTGQALVLGASRGLGLALVDELLNRRYDVIATTRTAGGDLQALANTSEERLQIEPLELTDSGSVAALHDGLGDRTIDLLFVNAAIDRGDMPITDVSAETFTEVMITNALSPLRALEALRDLVPVGGTVAIMSSDQGSIAGNVDTGYELYKASKAALNQLTRSYANRHGDDGHTKLLIDPGHNQTKLGGPGAQFVPADSMRLVANVLESHNGEGGLRFLDRNGEPVAW